MAVVIGKIHLIISMFQKITKIYNYQFSVDSNGLFFISISATCKRKNFLRLEIDGLALKGILPKSRNEYFNIPPAWNGNVLKGTSETIIFIIKLAKGNHNLKFVVKDEAELLFEPKIVLLEKSGLINLLQDVQSEEKDQAPWITVVLVNLPLAILDISVSCQRKFLDSDDVKLIIDGQIKKNDKVFWHGKNWFWRGYELKGKTQTNRFYLNLPVGIHYLELWADRTPTLKSFDILIVKDKDIEKPTKRIPSVSDPEWTGDFLDDPEEIILARLIFGEANNQPREAKEWVGWSVINRIKAKSWWPKTIHGVILQAGQYDPFKQTDSNFLKIINPLGYKNVGELDKKHWYECCEIAQNIILGRLNNPTEATHFHGIGVTKEWFEKNNVPKGKFIKKIGGTYFYWSPN